MTNREVGHMVQQQLQEGKHDAIKELVVDAAAKKLKIYKMLSEHEFEFLIYDWNFARPRLDLLQNNWSSCGTQAPLNKETFSYPRPRIKHF